jgi:CheY-like chemotaxis protein
MPPASLRVLVVDDHVDVADTLADLLGQLGFATRTAYDGTTAVIAATEFDPDVVVLDLRLPDMSGDDVCRALRALPRGESMRIIALSGWNRGDVGAEAACFDDFLTKPVGAATVLDLLSEASGAPSA